MKIQIGDEIRDMTQAEVANYSAVISEAESAKAHADAIVASVKKKLSTLGLTNDEIATLLP